ncbi:MAG: sigma-70 family RNA polymerase sigma factor [Myxococcota bacterium]
MTTLSLHLAPQDWTDQELLARLLVREGKAWREFHRRFDRLIYRCIHKVTARFRSVVGDEDVREIYAQFLVNITNRDMHKLRAYRPERGNKLGSWIGLLATNTAWDYLRSVARRPQCTEMHEAEDLRSVAADPYDELVAKERWGLVSDALQSFSEKDQRFMRLYFVEGLAPEEVAKEMNVSVKTVYSKKHKIRCRLERVIGSLAA